MMRKFFAHLFFGFFLFSCVAVASDVSPNSGVIKLGTYVGTIQTPNAIEMVVEKIDGKQFHGSLVLYVGDRLCRGKSQPMSGMQEDGGDIVIDATKDVLRGCERSMRLQAVGLELRGKFVGPLGEFSIVFKRKDT